MTIGRSNPDTHGNWSPGGHVTGPRNTNAHDRPAEGEHVITPDGRVYTMRDGSLVSTDRGPDDALAAAERPASHKDTIHDALWAIIETGNRFTADDVRASLPDEARKWLTLYPNVLGALFLGHSSAGTIRAVGWAQPRRASRRGNPVRIWQPVNYGAGE